MNESPKREFFHGVLWNLTERIGNQLIRFFLGVVLARLLMPEDYGVLALAAVVLVLSEILIDGGMMMTLIQRQNNSQAEYSTVFWSKVVASCFLYIVVYNLASGISSFYEVPALERVLQCMALILVISSLSAVHKIQLTNRLDFRGQAKIILISTLIGGGLGIALAIEGFGVWSLVVQSIVIQVIQTLLFWYYNRWSPSLIYSVGFIKSTFGTTFFFFMNNVLFVIYDNLYVFFLGKMHSPAVLGLYSRAKQFEQLPENTANSVIVKVLFPVLTRSKDKPDELRKSTGSILSWLVFIVTPTLLLVAINSEQIIRILLTEKWIGAKEYLVILSVAGILVPVNNALINVLNVLGKPSISTVVYILRIAFLLGVAVLAAGVPPVYLVSLLIPENMIVFLILCSICKRKIGLGLSDAVGAVGTGYLTNLLCLLLVITIPVKNIADSDVGHILITTCLYMALYFTMHLLIRSPQIVFMSSWIRKKKESRGD
ncbi:lipopolysaccharide biosynthesis protein [Halioglobus maricola]|nr:lipopolysaccharide biosynthesis protein [Halioglobus maricola]